MLKIVKLTKIPNKDILKDLVELFVYYHLSYPTNLKDNCSVLLADSNNEIITPLIKYKLTDELYIELYLLANKVIANLYKEINDYTIR